MKDRVSDTTMGGGKFLKVTTITIEDLQNMGRREGLVLQGCGGNPNDWINELVKIYNYTELIFLDCRSGSSFFVLICAVHIFFHGGSGYLQIPVVAV